MSQPFVGEIRLFAGNFPPIGWSFCDGAAVSIAENPVLFDLIGTTYGGDGQQTYKLPDLRGRIPIHQGGNGQSSPYVIGQSGGAEAVALTLAELPAHTHALNASTNAAVSTKGPVDALGASTMNLYGSATPNMPMEPTAIAPVGANQPHENMAHFTAINYIIAMFGVFPSQN